MGGSREGKDEAPGDRKGVRMRDGSQRGKAEGPHRSIKLEQLPHASWGGAVGNSFRERV